VGGKADQSPKGLMRKLTIRRLATISSLVPSASLHQQAVALVQTLRDALLKHGEITLRSSDLDPDTLGVTSFVDRAIHLDPAQGPDQWRSTLAHELLHLLRGPVDPDPVRVRAEEDAIEQLVANLFMPEAAALARRQWSPPERADLARYYEVDPDTVAAALNPPTVPMPRVASTPPHGMQLDVRKLP
jgi:hypothetical protein